MCAFLISNACDKPDVLKKEAYLEVENNSTMYDITGVYYSNLGYGSNRLKSNIKPGESKTFELSAEDDYIYNIMVTSSNTSIGDYTADDIHFYDDRRITVELYDDEWDDYYTW
jgi:hypothetical protein